MKPARIWEIRTKMSSRPTEFTVTYFVPKNLDSMSSNKLTASPNLLQSVPSFSYRLPALHCNSPQTNCILISLEPQNPGLARQSLFHAYFSISHGMPEPRPHQTAPIQSVSRFVGVTGPRPRQTAPIPFLLFFTSHGMPGPRPRQTAPIQSVSRFYLFYKNCSLSLCTSASQLMCAPCNVLQPGPQLSTKIKSQIPSSKFPLSFHSKPSTNAN